MLKILYIFSIIILGDIMEIINLLDVNFKLELTILFIVIILLVLAIVCLTIIKKMKEKD